MLEEHLKPIQGAMGELDEPAPLLIRRILLCLPIAWAAYQAWQYIYNFFFHPLAKFPGPISARISTFPGIQHTLKGDFLYWVCDLHAKYGDVVRVTPNELSFSGENAYQDIYGHKVVAQLPKDPKFYRGAPNETHNVVSSNAVDHARMRRIFSNAFSSRALKLQEPLFLTYVNQLVQKLRDGLSRKQDQRFDFAQLYTFTTFEVMSDLAFGEPLNLLHDETHHPWVAAVYGAFLFGCYLQCTRYFPMLEYVLLRWCMPKSFSERREKHHQFSVARVDRRLAKYDARPDIWGLVLEREEGSGMTREEMYANANLFMIGGTDTTATLLSGLTFYLLTNPSKMQKLVEEVRSSFETEEDITLEKLQRLKYLHACLEEGLRMYPSVPSSMARVTLSPVIIDGKVVPAGASVGVTTLAAFRNPNNFRDPMKFVPERWLDESTQYDSDKKQAFQPFLLGPRGCLGKNMAYHEMRLILTKLLFNFDISLCSESKNWLDQKIFLTWQRNPLYCQVKPVKRD